MTTTVRLHAPDEPVSLVATWRDRAFDGPGFDAVLLGEDSISSWLWSRWSAIAADGVTGDDLTEVLSGSRREVWLWLVGERTWAQTMSIVLGRLDRRR
jgi:hypothetical protein